MRRRRFVYCLALALIAACSSPVAARAKARGKKKPPPRVLKVGDEVEVWLDPDEAYRDANLEKSGAISARGLVFPACQQAVPDSRYVEYSYDVESQNRYLDAIRAGDRAGLDALIESGQAVRLPEGAGLVVLFRAARSCNARVLAGDAAGKVVEVPINRLK